MAGTQVATTAPGSRPPGPGRRERNRADKQRRILDAATRLFAEHGYSAVTTQQIADAADVGTGTLFRYAGSKAELLMQVMNERLRLGTDRGVELARQGAGPTEAVAAMLAPLAAESLHHPENTVVYQRETLFGSGPHRDVAAARVAAMETAILEVLRLHAQAHGRGDDPDLADYAHVVYGTLYMDLVQVGVGRTHADDLPARVRRTVGFVVGRLMQLPGSTD